ncbi:hypothetical protein BH11ACT2_BH11ACT2_12850 [soil metagenome]
MLIATSAVRMAVKNHLIVDALRDNRDYDPAALAAVARDEFLALAEQNDDSAARVWDDGVWDDEPTDSDRNQRKREVFRGLAVAMRAEAADADRLATVVSHARDAAWHEVGAVVEAKLVAPPEIVRDAAYEREREGRIRALKEVDLAGLETFERYRDLLN